MNALLVGLSAVLSLAPALAVSPLAMGDAELRTAIEVPTAIDLRPELERLGLSPRGQGARGTCSIFTACVALEYALAPPRGVVERLSPEFLNWAGTQSCGHPSDGNFFHHALTGFERFGLCGEAAWPYAARYDAEQSPSPDALAAAAELRDGAARALTVRWIEPWQPARFGLDETRFAAVREVLARGIPVAAGSSHSRLFVGYRDDAALPGGGAFLVLDSATARFDEVSYEFARAQIADAFYVERPQRFDARAATLIDRGRAAASIVVPATRAPSLDFAAQELQRWLAAIGGVELPIVVAGGAAAGGDDANGGAGGPRLLLGASDVAQACGALEEARALGADGVVVRTVGGDLVLAGGGPRGELYAVYELLERFLGCRFLARDAVVAPPRAIVTLPPLDWSYAPPFAYREVLCHDLADGTLAARLRLNGGNVNQCIGRANGSDERVGSVVICPFAHSIESMAPGATFFAAHPEWYGLVGGARRAAAISGQPCWTNEELLAHCTQWVLDWFAAHPEIDCVDVSQNDAWPGQSGACECERCAAVVAEEGSQHGPILRFVNAIAAAVAERFPGKTIETLAYQHTIAAPKVTRPRDDVAVRLCQHACYFHGIDCAGIGAEYRAALSDWRAAAKRIWVWHYGVNFWSYLAPNPNLAALASDLKRYARDGIDGVMVQADLQSRGGELAELRAYLVAQLLWDPTRDPLQLRRDFCAGYYGAGADAALEFLAQMDAWGAALQHHVPMNGWNPPDVTPPEFIAAGLATLEPAIDRLTAAGDAALAARRHLEKLALPLWFLQLGYPDRYPLTREQQVALLARVRRVFAEAEVTTISEGPPNAEAFLQAVAARVGGG
ncbi:MAG: DUF4838 domain-containing protein [Planctomycetes bacterium]|nr:DUF4838 domain-containing protein [Planctomycetota bacterium]